MVEAKGSDLHLTAGRRPMARLDGNLVPLEEFEVLNPSMCPELVYEDPYSKTAGALREQPRARHIPHRAGCRAVSG